MKFDGFSLKVLVSVAMLWGMPVEVKAAETHQARAAAFISGPLGKENAAPHLKTMPVLQPSAKQVTDGEPQASPVLLEVEGVLADGDEQLDDESLYDVHEFEGDAGQIVRITLTSDEFDTVLFLLTTSGEELTRNDDGPEGTNAEIVFRLPETGPYRLLANAHDPSSRGAYQLTVAQADEQALRKVERKAEADNLFRQGREAFRVSQYQSALEFWQSALAIDREIGDRQGEAVSLGILGIAYDSLGDYQRAIDFHQQSLAIAREIGDRQGEANSLGNLGLAYRNLGEYQRAIDFHQQHLVIAREIGDRQGEATSLGSLGIAYDSLGEYQRAMDFYQQSLAIAREIGFRQGEATSLGNLGRSYDSLGDYERAIDFYQQHLAIAREIGDRLGEANSLTNLGISYLSQQNVALAEEVLREAVSMFEKLRTDELPDQNQISFFETQVNAYRNLETVLVLQEEYETALEIAERGRTQAFVRLLSERLSTEVENQEIRKSPNFGDIQAIAKSQNSTLVEYSRAPSPSGDGESIFVWIVKPTGELYFEEVPLSEASLGVSILIEKTRDAMDVRGRGGLESATSNADDSDASGELRELHQLLIDPIKQWLPTNAEERVVFIPQGELFLVPFSALQDESGTHLIEKHTILTTPSIQVLDLTERQATAASGATPTTEILTVGNPVMPEVWDPEKDVSVQLSSLGGAEREAQAIANFFNTEALIGAQATEEAVKQQIGNARIVHLATHGLLEYGVPEESGVRDVPGAIALTPTDTEDGLLTASEIIEELTLQAELVVLSACDTGLGTITGDGVIGLSRSLIAAGTPSVIVSLWAIPDAPTAELMTEFYSQRQQGLDKAQALRQAMLETMKTHPNPRDWAAFSLIGEAD